MSSSTTFNLESKRSSFVRSRLSSIADQLQERQQFVKSLVQYQSDGESDSDESIGDKIDHNLNELNDDESNSAQLVSVKGNYFRVIFFNLFISAIDPQNIPYLLWLFLVSLAYMFQCYTITFRYSFSYVWNDENRLIWIGMDILCDFIYLMDMIFVKMRKSYIEDGLEIKDTKRLRYEYIHSGYFKIDVLSCVPIDLLYLIPYLRYAILLRLNRFLKLGSFVEFFMRLDQHVKRWNHFLRMLETFQYMIFLIHCESCIYYVFSLYEEKTVIPIQKAKGIENNWYLNATKYINTNHYVVSFYLCAKLATSIGNNPRPTNSGEYLFMTSAWLVSVFVFAFLIGQMKDIIQSARANKMAFHRALDLSLSYLKMLQVPDKLLNKVRDWYLYNWEKCKTLDEDEVLQFLPARIQTDVAIYVHYETLRKVNLFQNCEKNVLYNLVLKLKSMLCLPGDYICRCGEVGKEMYIVNSGELIVRVNGKVVATLRKGSVFGEISLLAIGNSNRRTADVISKGYSALFILHKSDLHEVLRDYPEVDRLLKKRANKIVKKQIKRVEDNSQISLVRHLKDLYKDEQNPTIKPLFQKTDSAESKDAKLLSIVSKVAPRYSKTLERMFKWKDEKKTD
ncbi:hypothetical protein SNEBB_001649 [Seison nebaliae]|nr:hypothetical protein SNEBB_001649 [Seison nebaliae]